MKITNLSVLLGIFAPEVVFAASNDFVVAAQLLAAAKNSDVQQIQILINNGANINYVDNTGMSLVCTALMNNDMRAAQVLQMYGADASNCDKQIKNYRNKNLPKKTGGFFGGLSTAQGLALTGAAAAAVVGGIYLFTDLFDSDDGGNSGGSGSGSGSGSGGNGGNNSSGDKLFSNGLPYGPLLVDAAAENSTYQINLKDYAPNDVDSIFYKNFQLMSASQNYLLLMRGYSPFARGYLGMRTLRNTNTWAPLSLGSFNFNGNQVGGGRPVNVALITANGINAADGTSLGNKFLVWTENSSPTSLQPAGNSMISSKYYNNVISFGGDSSATDDETVDEDVSFDLSNSGTAINNVLAAVTDNLLGKIVGGDTSLQTNGDFVGFMPNGQMTIYRTGGGNAMVELDSPVDSGTYHFHNQTNLATGDTLGVLGDTWTATVNDSVVILTSADQTLNGYIGVDGLLYLDSTQDGSVDVAYSMANDVLDLVKQKQSVAYYNYAAMVNAANRATATSDAASGGRSKVDVIANLDVVESLHGLDANTISDILSYPAANYQTEFISMINDVYGAVDSNGYAPGVNAAAFFTGLGTNYSPFVVFSTGGSQTDADYSGRTYEATFENAAPLVFSGLEHLFMSVVAVGADTSGQTSIAANSSSIPSSGKYELAKWNVGDNYFKSRVCGVAGRGANGLDPWCFAAVGLTDENAAAAAAGAAGVVRSAFYNYMTPQQVYMLLALTADGPFLKTLTDGTTLTNETLISHLQSMYTLPAEYQVRVNSGENYLDVFKEVFGYGVMNLERATKPGTNLYYYSSGKIISSPNNAYWRSALNTSLRGSGALNLDRVSMNVSAFDVLESVDGSMSLPRVWENNVEIGGTSRHELYMGDVLGDFRVSDLSNQAQQIGNIAFSLNRSDRMYDDGMGGLDNLRLEYQNENWHLGADYQRYLTDGESRFTGLSNPILALVSNAVTTGAEYNVGGWSFGGRAFSGVITDEGLLDNDPAISTMYAPMQIGQMVGAESKLGWQNEHIGVKTAFGVAHENGTLLGAAANGFISFDASDTMYIDSELRWTPRENVALRLHGTFAHTTPNNGTENMVSLSELDSMAFGFDATIGGFTFGVSHPLTVYNGKMRYSYAEYEISEIDDTHYDLVVSDSGIKNVNVAPNVHEYRLSAAYRHKLGEFTDGAIGFIYRINPNNTDEFGNESIFMMKMSHRLGI